MLIVHQYAHEEARGDREKGRGGHALRMGELNIGATLLLYLNVIAKEEERGGK